MAQKCRRILMGVYGARREKSDLNLSKRAKNEPKQEIFIKKIDKTAKTVTVVS